MKYPESPDHCRRMSDAHKREEQTGHQERNAVQHFLCAYGPLTDVKGKEGVQAGQREQPY
jgi:hypothetical protein